MKLEAVIRPRRLTEVQQALVDIGIRGMTVSEVRSFGRRKENGEKYRGADYRVDFLPEILIAAIVPDKRLQDVFDTIQDGTYGDALNGATGTVKGLLYGDASQFLAQIIGVAVNFTFVFASVYVFFKVVEM